MKKVKRLPQKIFTDYKKGSKGGIEEQKRQIYGKQK